jgi:hypothetical protein
MCLTARGNQSSSSSDSDGDDELLSYDKIVQDDLEFAKLCTSQQKIKKIKRLKSKGR